MSNGSSPPGLTITAVAARTGVSVPSLRAWEQRYGFPRPERPAGGGHRRYADDEVDRIAAVVAARHAGLSLHAAIERVLASDPGGAGDVEVDATVFAAVRRRHPDVPVVLLHRRTMLALSRAIEDESSARSEPVHLVAAFQHAERYRRAHDERWRALARHAASTIVFADFDVSRVDDDRVLEVAFAPGSPQEREWTVVADAPGAGAIVAGWERSDGRFEAVWSVEPAVVRTATLAARALATRWAPALPLPPLPPPSAAPSAQSLRHALAVGSRVVSRLDRP